VARPLVSGSFAFRWVIRMAPSTVATQTAPSRRNKLARRAFQPIFVMGTIEVKGWAE
jgi:hypothetical protein